MFILSKYIILFVLESKYYFIYYENIKMSFINISSDNIHIIHDNQENLIDIKFLERTLPATLKVLYDNKPFKKFFVLNWPWSFTSLRVWCLSLNMLNFLFPNQGIKLLSISKIDLYNYLVNQWVLPYKWLIYIWQRKNMRLYDFKLWKFDLILIDDLRAFKEEVFVDKMFSDYYLKNIDLNKMVWFWFEDQSLKVTFLWNKSIIDISSLGLLELSQIQPNYIIQPNISV